MSQGIARIGASPLTPRSDTAAGRLHEADRLLRIAAHRLRGHEIALAALVRAAHRHGASTEAVQAAVAEWGDLPDLRCLLERRPEGGQ